jgi:hypothetical protein
VSRDGLPVPGAVQSNDLFLIQNVDVKGYEERDKISTVYDSTLHEYHFRRIVTQTVVEEMID